MVLFTKKMLYASSLVLMFHGMLFAGDPPYLPTQNGGYELTWKRDRNTKHFRNTNGSFTMITSAGSLHYKTENGAWADINTKIGFNRSGSFAELPYANTANAFKTFFPEGLGKQGIVTILGKDQITETGSGYYFKLSDGNSHPVAFTTGNSVVTDNSISYPVSGEQVSIRYTILNDQRKLDWLLNDRSLAAKAPANAVSLVFYETIVLPQNWIIVQEGDILMVYNELHQRMIQYEQPFIHEARMPDAHTTEDNYRSIGSYKVIQSGNQWVIETLVDLQWLTSPSRNYPVVVDPTASYYPDNTNFWTGYQTSATGKTNGFMRITSGLNVGWAKFNISSLPSAAIVTQTVMNSYHYTTTGTKDVNVNDMNATDPVAAAAGTISSAIAANDAYINNYPFGGTSFGWRNATLGSAANADIVARRSQGWTAMGFNYVSGSTTFMYHYGWNGTFPPYLSITYLDALIDASVTALLSPATVECGRLNTDIIVKVKNNSASDSVTGLPVTCVISGTISSTLTGTLNRKLYAGTEDTIHLIPTFNTLSGANLQFSVYTSYGNDPNHSNDTMVVNSTIHAVPSLMLVSGHASSQGTKRSGIMAEPDHAKAGDSMVYELQPPAGFSPAQFGSAWTVSLITVKTAASTNLGNFYQGVGSSGNPILVLKPQTSEVDSLYKIDITYRTIATGCDSIKTLWFYVAPVPAINFSADSTCFGHITQFSNQTTMLNEIPVYRWDFGTTANDDTSDVEDPSFMYNAAGNYTATLSARTSLGYVVSQTKTVTILHKPFSVFTFKNACDGKAVTLTNQSTIGGSQTTLTYVWDLGDGSFSTATNVSPIYNTFGTYNVYLKATSLFGCSDSVTKSITVYENPVVDFSATNTCTNQNVKFTNHSGIGAGLLGHVWDFGDGTDAIVKTPEKTYTASGSFSVKLKVFSDFGCNDSITKTVVVAPSPVADFTTASFCSNDGVKITNTSTIQGGGTLAYQWNFGNGDTSTSALPVITEFYQPGNFDIRLKVTSGSSCEAEVLKSITVFPNPVASFLSTSPLCEKSDITFTNASTIQSGAISYQWNFQSAGSSTNEHPVANFVTAGTKTVSLKASSDKGCTDSVGQTIEIKPAPNADFSLTTLNFQKMRISLQPAVTTHFSYNWDMGDGSTSNQVSPVYSYLQNGVFKVTLKVTDINQCENATDTSVMFNVGTSGPESQTGLRVYPVPANEFMNLVLLNKQQVPSNYQLIDISGKVIASGDLFNDIRIETTNIPAGMYLLRVISATDILNTQKIIISH